MQNALPCLSDGNSATARDFSGFWFWGLRGRLPPRVLKLLDENQWIKLFGPSAGAPWLHGFVLLVGVP